MRVLLIAVALGAAAWWLARQERETVRALAAPQPCPEGDAWLAGWRQHRQAGTYDACYDLNADQVIDNRDFGLYRARQQGAG